MKKFLVAILAITLFAVGAIFVIAQVDEKSGNNKKGFGKQGRHAKHGKRGKRNQRGHMMGKRMFRHLDLTDAQKTQMQAIMKSNREDGKALRKQMHANRQELQKSAENGAFNESQIEAIAQKQGDLHAKMIVHKQKTKAQMYSVLTSDQKAKLAETKANFKKKKQERKAKWAEKRNKKTKP